MTGLNPRQNRRIHMKSLRILLPLTLFALSTIAFAQSDSPKSFDTMKTLAGTWTGPVKLDPPNTEMGSTGKPVRVSLRVTSRGNAIVHEMQEDATVEDATKYDHPVTMFYEDNGRLILTHYCDAGNRPRMEGKLSPDGKTVDFTFLDVSGSTQFGHMQHATFTVIDANHHTEDWTYLMPGDKLMHAHFDLTRAR
jgi:hypothetical protein